MTKVFTGPSSGELLVQADNVNFKMLMLATAANIIQSCSETIPDPAGYPESGALGVLRQSKELRWASHGYINALQSQVSLLYSYAETLVKSNWDRKYLVVPAERQIFARALDAYQIWKTELLRKDEERNGKGFGKGTEFYQKDWSDMNPALLNEVEVP